MAKKQLTGCLQIADRLSADDLDNLLARIDELRGQGVGANEAQLTVAQDLLAEAAAERDAFMQAMRGQHPDLFPSRAPRGAGEAAVSAAKNTAAGVNATLDALGALFGGSPGKLSSGLTFDPETYEKAKPLFKDAVSHFKTAGADIREVMRAVMRAMLGRFGRETTQNMKPYVVRFIEDVYSGAINLESDDASTTGESAQQGGREGQPEIKADGSAVPNEAGGTGQVSGAAGQGADGVGARSDRRAGVSDAVPASRRERSDQQIRGDDGGFLSEGGLPGDSVEEGTGEDRGQGTDADAQAEGSPVQLAPLEERLRQQKAAESVEVKLGDTSNVAATLPLLMPTQHEDVLFAENRLMKPDGYGVLFTNGTGTGKTFTGLGVIKRMHKAGKKRGLIVVPNDAVMTEWTRSAAMINLTIRPLESTSDAGRGIAITTYANLANNRALADRDIDFLVADEAHNLMSNADAKVTSGLRAARAVTLHPDSARDRADMIEREAVDRIAVITSRYDWLNRMASKDDTMDEMRADYLREAEELDKERATLQAKYDATLARERERVESSQNETRPRAIFLSATPFAYEKNTDWASGYLFQYPAEPTSRAYNTPNGREQFLIQHFGYRMKTGKLTEPDAKVDRGLMQRQFNTWLRQQGALSARMLNVDRDYDRKFVLIDGGIGTRIDQALRWMREAEGGRFYPFYSSVNEKFDYLARSRLLEAIKAKAAIPYIKAQHALGRKVIVFYDFNEGGAFNAFNFNIRPDTEIEAQTYNKDTEKFEAVKYKAGEFLDAFRREFPDLASGEFAKARSPLETLTEAFPGAAVYNGVVKKSGRQQGIDDFNNDDKPEANLLIVQSSANAGWSGHDRTGKHQRVIVNLGLPVAPTKAIQQEGRAYRVGQATDAIFRYFNTGTLWERFAFATKIARRASTAENLAMGEDARFLLQSFLDAFDESDAYQPSVDEGKGGKARDRAGAALITDFDRAKSFYYGQQKKNAGRNNREGTDYFATPEPVGLKMVEWLNIEPADRLLEPSAGHGAIARWFPETTNNTVVEPSLELSSRLALATDAKLINDQFERLHIGNKYDGIAMNPPFGVGAKTAIDHLSKAYNHLAPGGRVVALLPEGPAADKRLEAWLYGADAKGRSTLPDARLTAVVSLPTSTFERAGTAVKTRIVVIDKAPDSKASTPDPMRIDLSGYDDINALFDAIQNISIPRTRAAATEMQANAGGMQAPATPGRVVENIEQAMWEVRDGKLVTDAPEVEYTTKAGKLLKGVYVFNKKMAQQVDERTFKSREMPGFFVRMKHVVRPPLDQQVEESSTGGQYFDLALPTAGRASWTPERIDQIIRYYRNSGMSAYAAWVSPEQFLQATTPANERQRMEAERTKLDKAKLAGEDQWIYLDAVPAEDGSFTLVSHEGRHRMMALRDAGVDRVPVAIALRDGAKMSEDDLAEAFFGRQTYDGGKTAAQRGFASRSLLPINEQNRDELIRDFGRPGTAVQFDIAVTENGASPHFGTRPEPIRAETLNKLRALERKIRDGKITPAEYRLGVQEAIAYIETRNEVQAARKPVDRRRGADWIIAQMRRGVADDTVLRGEAEFVEWLLAQNPELANDLGISISTKLDSAGAYNPASRVMSLLSGSTNGGTAVHEILHHSERMMPPEVQAGVTKAWKRAWDAAYQSGDEALKQALRDMTLASMGDEAALERTKARLKSGTLDYAQHYQLYSPSEYWAVNATRILSGRHTASGSWVQRAVVWFKEFVQRVKGLLGLRSDAPILKGLEAVLAGDGTFVTKQMLSEQTTYFALQGQQGAMPSNTPAVPPPVATNAQANLGLQGGQNTPGWQIGDPTKWDRFVYNMQDRQINLKRVEEEIRKVSAISDQFDGYLKEELYHGRVAARTEKFLARELRPLMVDLRQKNVTIEELEAYLWARHAPERNAQVASINPAMPDGGSGLTNAEVAQYMAGNDVMRPNPTTGVPELYLKGMKTADLAKLDALAARIDAMNAGTKQILIQYGLEDPNTIAAWDAKYKHYVPLHREDFGEDTMPIGQGFSVKGPFSQRALGSERKVVDILAHIAMQREAAITKGEKNRVAMSIYGLALQNPNPDFWTVGKVPMKRVIDPNTGLVVSVPDRNYKNDPNVLVMRVGGQDRAIIFNEHNERAKQTAAVLKNLDIQSTYKVIEVMGIGTRYFAAMNTQFNPVFGVFNLMRDVGGTALNLTSTPLAGKQRQVFTETFKALRAIWKIERHGSSGTAYDQIYDQMKMAGGTTGYREVFRLGKDRADKLRDEIRAIDAGAMKKVWFWLRDWLDHFNTALENASRLATYKIALENGLTVERSASLSKNITVNFNRKGKVGRELGLAYAFFNSAVQGTARMAETLQGPAGRRIIAGGIGLGVLQVLVAMLAFDREEWEDIPAFVRDRSFIIPVYGTKGGFVAIPLPLGFNALPAIGRTLAELAWAGGRDPGKKFAELFATVANAFNPLGSAPSVTQAITPTVLDIVAALEQNLDWTGRKIFKEDRNESDPTPGFTRARDSSTRIARSAAEIINTLTGGTKYVPGAWSPTPEQLEYVVAQVFGGVGREVARAYSSADMALRGEDVPEYKKPMWGRLVGSTDEEGAVSARYWRYVRELNTLDREYKGRRRDNGDYRELERQHPEAIYLRSLEKTERRIDEMRSRRHKIEFDEMIKDEAERTRRLKDQDRLIQEEMRRYIADVQRYRQDKK